MEELVFVLIFLAVTCVAITIILLAVAGLAALCGGTFLTVFVKGLWALLLPPALVLYGWLIGRDRIAVNTVEIVSEDIPESFDGYRIVHISDMHLRSFRNRKGVLFGIVDRINALRPDLIAFTGDLVTSHPSETEPFMDALRRLEAADGVLSVMGNHDYCPYNDWKSAGEREKAVAEVRAREREAGWTLLDNDCIVIGRKGADGTDSIAVAGVENISAMKQFESYGDLPKALEGASGSFRILLSHDPTFWRQGIAGKADIGLTLSGHTHNAQMKILGLEPSRLVFRENSGLYCENTRYGRQYLYVNDGLGETMFPARVGVPAEITVLVLKHGS